ncbi:MAG: phosphatidate cytidylyltransferase [Saccharofermentanales bacterium]
MKTRVITGLIFAAVIAGFVLPGYIFPQLPLLLFFLVAAICIIEVSTLVKTKLSHLNQAMCVIGSLFVFTPLISVLIHGDLDWRLIIDSAITSPNKLSSEREIIIRYVTESISLLFLFMMIFAYVTIFYFIIKKGPSIFIDAVSMSLVVFYVVVPIVCGIVILYFIPNGFLWMLAAMITSWVSDVFSYFTGVTLGKHKIIPLISPKKTWEGSIGGILGSIFVMIIWFLLIMNGPDIVEKSIVYRISFGVILGLLASVLSQLGDWFASAIKRWGHAKDFGTFLPGHGGLTDRFDGVLFTFPIILASALFYYLF